MQRLIPLRLVPARAKQLRRHRDTHLSLQKPKETKEGTCMMNTGIAAALALALSLLSGCSQQSGAISGGFGALDAAYASDVKPADAKFSECKRVEVKARQIVRCGISYGGDQLAQVGYWEIEGQGDSFTVYAMNGKALTALEKINHPDALSIRAFPGAFKSGQGRTVLDMDAVSQAFK